jgi:hypothetical protein
LEVRRFSRSCATRIDPCMSEFALAFQTSEEISHVSRSPVIEAAIPDERARLL